MGGDRKIIGIFLLFFGCYFACGQEQEYTLKNKSFDELFTATSKTKSFDLANKVENQLIQKLKIENNFKFQIDGYHTQAIIRNDKSIWRFCERVINLIKLKTGIVYPREAYLLKADYFFNNSILDKALKNYLKVSFYSQMNNDPENIIKSKYDIETLKRRINETEEVLSLYKESCKYLFTTENKIDTPLYFTVIAAIASVYNYLGQHDYSSHYNKLGHFKALKDEKESHTEYFALNQGASLYHMSQLYQEGIDSLAKDLPYYERNAKQTNLSLAYYYCAKSYSHLGQFEKSINYYKKVDTIFQIKRSIDPISIASYHELIQYYKNKNDLENELLYVNQLIQVNRVLQNENLSLSKDMSKEYDIPQLKSEKEQIVKQMYTNDASFKQVLATGFIMLFISLNVLVYQYQKKNSYKKKFEALMNPIEKKAHAIKIGKKGKQFRETINKGVRKKLAKEKSLDISPEIVASILESLKLFEQEQQFLSDTITLHSLAKKLHTNSNYLSRVVNTYKKKSFANYLNLLRIKHFIRYAKKDPDVRKFTIKAIASEVGFRNTESFSKAFFKYKRIRPSYFLQGLQKKSKNLVLKQKHPNRTIGSR